MPHVIDPVRLYVNHLNGGAEVCKVLCAPVPLTVANNQLIVAAVTGKRIRIIGFSYQSKAAGAASFLLRSGSGGAVIHELLTQAGTGSPPILFPKDDGGGYCETASGTGLYADNAGNLASLNVYYITYTPVS